MTRFRAGTRARQAQARVKQLAKIERIDRGAADGAALGFSFKPPERSGRVVFELENGRIGTDGAVLLDGAELWLERGEHVSLVGPNGAGKTTLVEALTARRELEEDDGVTGGLNDAQLLERFVTARDEAAFRALVVRHGSMVLRVCRGVLHDTHDAEDAFQVTFLALARKAGSIRKQASIASWLHGTAHHVALRARTAMLTQSALCRPG